MDDLTLDNFFARTGFRFRVSKEQRQRIEAGTLTREQAFEEFLSNGGIDRLQNQNKQVIPDTVFQDPDLTLDNFAEKVAAVTGTPRRFRVSRDQAQRIRSGELTREQAFQETLQSRRVQS